MKHDDIIKICMCDCQLPNLNSANIYFWPLGGHFAKYNSRQIFWLYGRGGLTHPYKKGILIVGVIAGAADELVLAFIDYVFRLQDGVLDTYVMT